MNSLIIHHMLRVMHRRSGSESIAVYSVTLGSRDHRGADCQQTCRHQRSRRNEGSYIVSVVVHLVQCSTGALSPCAALIFRLLVAEQRFLDSPTRLNVHLNPRRCRIFTVRAAA